MTKICTKCGEEKSLTEFNKKGKGLQSSCRSCNSLMLKEHYLNNKQYYKEKADRRYDEARGFINKIKDAARCSACGENHPATLEFHHLSEKEINIALAPVQGWSITRIQKEMDKCMILCSNCHRKLHYNENTSVV